MAKSVLGSTRRHSGLQRFAALGTLLLAAALATPAAAQQSSPDELLARARTLLDAKSYDEAGRLIDQALVAAPDSARGLWLRAELERKTDRMDAARADYERLTQIVPDSNEAWFWVATIDRWQGRYADAVGEYDRVLASSPCYRDALTGKGRALILADDPAAAVAPLRKALECRPDDTEAADLLADSLTSSGQKEEARKVLEGSFTGAELERRLGDLELSENDPEAAVDHYERAAAATPDDPAVWRDLGAARRRADDIPGALEAYKRAADIEPGNTGTLYWVGVLSWWNGDSDGALAAYDAILEREPDNTNALVGKARVLWARGYRDEALALTSRVLAEHPDNSDARVLHGRLLAAQGYSEEARLDYRTVLLSNPDNRDAQIALRRLGARHSWNTEARYSRSEVIEGLDDAGITVDGQVIEPTRIEYLSEGAITGVNSALRNGLDLAVSVSKFRQGVFNLDNGRTVYDYDVWTATAGLDHVLAPHWTLSWRAGATRYKPRDTASIATDTRANGRAELIYDDGRTHFSASYSRSPFIQRGFAGNFAFRIFDQDRVALRLDQDLGKHFTLYTGAAIELYNDGDTPWYGDLALGWQRGGSALRLGVRHDPFPARFLGVNDHLDFVNYDIVYLAGRTDLGWGFQLDGDARLGRFGATHRYDYVNGARLEGPLAHNTQRQLTTTLAWTPPGQHPFTVGVEYFTDHYNFDTGEYNNNNINSWTAFAQLADDRHEGWRYRLRYARGLSHDERAASYDSNIYTGLFEVRLGQSPFADEAAWLGGEAEYLDNTLTEKRQRYRLWVRIPL